MHMLRRVRVVLCQVYQLLHFEAEDAVAPPPPLRTFDSPDGNVVSMGTFSKVGSCSFTFAHAHTCT